MDTYAQFFHAFPLATLIVDSHRKILDMNEEARSEFSGIERQSIIDALHQEFSIFAQAKSQHVTFEKELDIFQKNQPKYYRIRLSKVNGPHELPNILITFTCITEKIRLREELIHLAQVVDSSDDAIIAITLNRVVTSWNTGAERTYGIPAREALGKSIEWIIPKSMQQEFNEIMDGVGAGKSFIRHEMVHRHGDSHIFPVSVTISPVQICGKVASVSIISRDITSRRLAEMLLQKSHEQLKGLLNDVVRSLSTVHEKRDLYTSGHQLRVAEISLAIGRALGLPAAELDILNIAALLHDIGKVSIPMAILAKPAQLEHPEMLLMQRHPEVGGDILFNIAFPGPVVEIILQHHERMDGSGYPRGLSGDDIVFGARIIAVADTLEAMSAHRPYRPALGLDFALQEIKQHCGGKYDSTVCSALFNLVQRNVIKENGGQLRVEPIPD
jgi:PAS domain S-box-containing protein/putative nucleotidyltransferase with HDIG domain